MSEDLVVAIITAFASLTGVIITTRSFSKEVTKELEKMNVKQSTDIDYIKNDMSDMKKTLHEHNTYASKFVDMQGQLNVILNRVQATEHRVSNLESKMEVPPLVRLQQIKDEMGIK